ncbi:hypothetical protein ACIRP2_37525 [Streptomyces sp. NPDC101194]|uniref:hypothetical protein n=1 Tax=Streptomyces sp. NPDC101194 TaxID=3366127 RepID=UPI0038076F52
MARTAHHTPYKQTPHERARRYERACRVEDDRPYAFWRHVSGPHRAAVVYDLRYSTAELATASGEGRRPRPQKIRRSFAIYRYCCAHSQCIGDLAKRDERVARSRTRAALLATKYDPDIDIPPTRHRYSAHRNSW